MSSRFDRSAANEGFVKEVVRGAGFDHAVFSASNRPRGESLHIYFGGDGLPWRTRTVIANDPTPREPVGLELMARDSDDGLYLGRPCYHGLRSPDCHPLLWTSLRYSEPVVESMAVAVRRLVARHRPSRLLLVGYSGGGVLAMLVAERVVETDGVITIGANLDVRGWANHHGYSTLLGSLSPAERPALAESIQQLHLVGGLDQVVPEEFIAPTAQRQTSARLEVMPEFDHVCCWQRIWPDILASFASERRPSRPRSPSQPRHDHWLTPQYNPLVKQGDSWEAP